NPHNDTVEKMIYRMKEFTAEILDPLKINYSFAEGENLSEIKLDVKKRKDFYLVFKEAVNNAAKYSQCRNLDIQLLQDQQSILLKVVDDGTGFNQELVKPGNGLGNMRERASSMKAGLRIDSAVGKGTSIRVDLPIA
ncbi:MAG TPA: ATP-binding protein, partial [Puia sp.]|nr:ATP-binding protein [Puia sp.]